MYKIIIYEDSHGRSQLGDFLDDLARRAPSNKDARIQLKQVTYCINLLQLQGTRLPQTITKRLTSDLWELRPGDNRIFYFLSCGDSFVLLHQFRKKTVKTPQSEIEAAQREIADYKHRMERKRL